MLGQKASPLELGKHQSSSYKALQFYILSRFFLNFTCKSILFAAAFILELFSILRPLSKIGVPMP